MGFLDGELEDDDGDGFLEDIEDESGGFLEGIEQENESELDRRPPHQYSVSDEELREEHWQEDYYDVTDTVEESSSSMKTGECGRCGYTFCVAKKNRSFGCSCGAWNIDFGWEDKRI